VFIPHVIRRIFAQSTAQFRILPIVEITSFPCSIALIGLLERKTGKEGISCDLLRCVIDSFPTAGFLPALFFSINRVCHHPCRVVLIWRELAISNINDACYGNAKMPHSVRKLSVSVRLLTLLTEYVKKVELNSFT